MSSRLSLANARGRPGRGTPGALFGEQPVGVEEVDAADPPRPKGGVVAAGRFRSRDHGVGCVVAAPSKLQRPTGDRVKTDARDAAHLARLLKLDEIVEVTVPSPTQEAARDLVRAREDVRGDLMRARHRLSKLLLRQGIVWTGGQPWTGRHDV
ncbi:MAG TPA: transposase [Propionibacteriaceae bacterium]|nr:transposase [Propionibacteriaceae bacterium]